jgi:hypothetical protein
MGRIGDFGDENSGRRKQTTCHTNEESGGDEHASVFGTSLKTRSKNDKHKSSIEASLTAIAVGNISLDWICDNTADGLDGIDKS